MRTYKIGNEIPQNGDDDYYKQTIHLKKLLETLQVNDYIVTFRSHTNRILSKFKFIGYEKCNQMGKEYDYKCCLICKGYLQIADAKICPGYTHSLQSAILRIEKNADIQFLDSKLFEL